jgi:hypothetical protein
MQRVPHVSDHGLHQELDPRLLQMDRPRQDGQADETRDEA